MLLSSIIQKVKLLNKKGSIAFILSLVTLASVAPEAKAQQTLMESDRLLEYSYRWQGHRPRGESECLQAAGQDLLGRINQMSNISQFDSYTGSRVNRELSNKFENIGKYIRNTTVFKDGRSSSGRFTAAQRGLVVSVTPKRFKPGTFGNSYKRDRWTGKRESACWGTLLYEFQIYGPNNIARKGSTNTPSSRGRDFYFKNNCTQPIKLTLRYRKLNGDWITRGWWSFDPGKGAYLASSGRRIQSDNNIFYYYAYIPNSNYSWSGSEKRSFGGRTYAMRKKSIKVNADGNRYLKLSCNNR